MSITSEKVRLDGLLRRLSVHLESYQADYLASHGRYWQGISLLPDVPQHSTTYVPNVSRKPILRLGRGQREDWSSLGFDFPARISGALQVDVYQTPSSEWGYVVTASIADGRTVWQKSVATGPEANSYPTDWVSEVPDAS